eukprot:scaffold174401_cov31-Tisochrysis_lutea.AAC.2
MTVRFGKKWTSRGFVDRNVVVDDNRLPLSRASVEQPDVVLAALRQPCAMECVPEKTRVLCQTGERSHKPAVAYASLLNVSRLNLVLEEFGHPLARPPIVRSLGVVTFVAVS